MTVVMECMKENRKTRTEWVQASEMGVNEGRVRDELPISRYFWMDWKTQQSTLRELSLREGSLRDENEKNNEWKKVNFHF